MAKHSFNIEDEFTKNKNLKEEDIKTLIEWTKNQPHLPEITDHQAVLFLQRWNYQTETAKAGIDSFFTFRTFYSDVFANRNPLKSPLKDSLDVLLYTVLNKRHPDGYPIIFINIMDANPDNYHLIPLLRYLDMVITLHLQEEGTSEGYIIVMDIGKYNDGLLAKLDPFVMTRFLFYLQEVIPFTLKGLHFFNLPEIMQKVTEVVEPAMKSGLLHLHDTVDKVFEYIPQECFPEEYGGSDFSSKVLLEKIKKKFFNNVSFFEWQDSQKVSESKRQTKPKRIIEILDKFGIE